MKKFLTLTILVLMSVTAVAQYIDGAALLIPGTIFTVLAVNSYEMAGNIIYGMLAVPGLVLGTGLLVLSIPFYWSGISKLKTVVQTYNPQRLSFAPELSLGAQPSGIGMGIRF